LTTVIWKDSDMRILIVHRPPEKGNFVMNSGKLKNLSLLKTTVGTRAVSRKGTEQLFS